MAEKTNVGSVEQPARGASQSAERPASDAAPRVRGKTYIADEVISVIARNAAEQVEGVHQIGTSNLRGMVSRLGRHAGVDSEIGLKEAAVDIELVVDFGYPIKDVTEEVRNRVIESLESTTGRRVVEVNIWVVDVHVERVERRPRRQLE